jgi:4-amino-4-deoxy-L-arabinose transferase-like glycosyltransferase
MALNNSAGIILVLSISLSLLCIGAPLRDLTFPDELRYAEISREMIESGNWILPSFNYQVYADKPPLFFWMMAASMTLFGMHILPAMLPSFLSAILTILMTYLLGKEMFHREVGLYSAWILSTFLLFIFMAQLVRMDMTLTLLITSALYLFYRALREKGHALRLALTGYLCTGTALLTKGPVGLMLPAFILLAYLYFKKEMYKIKNLYPVRGFLIMAALALLWIIPAGLEGGKAYLQEILLTQSAGRVIGSFAHAKPVYYYLIYFPFLFVPWSIYLLLCFDPGLRAKLSEDKGKNLFLICWVLGTLLFFSLVSGKIVIYLLPLTPALALLIARIFNLMLKEPKVLQKPHLFQVSAYLIAGICFLGPVVFFALDFKAEFLHNWLNLFPTILVLVLSGTFLIYYSRRMNVSKVFITTGLLSLLVALTITLWVFPSFNSYLSLKPMADRILTIQKNDSHIAGYKIDLRYLSFYLHTPYDKLLSTKELKRYVLEGRGLLIVTQQEIPFVKQVVPVPLLEVGKFRLKGKRYHLFLGQAALI